LTYACQIFQSYGTLISSTILRIYSNTLTLSYSESTPVVVGARLKLLNMIDNNTWIEYEFIFVTYDFDKTIWQMTFERLTYYPYHFFNIYSFLYNWVIDNRTGGTKMAEFESFMINMVWTWFYFVRYRLNLSHNMSLFQSFEYTVRDDKSFMFLWDEQSRKNSYYFDIFD